MPLGAVEQHGPHLPVALDQLVVGHVARLAAERAEATKEVPVLVTPVVAFGSSHHHLPYGGTLSVRSSTLAALLADLLGSAAAWGVRRVVLLNGHGGNEDIARQAARDAALVHPGKFAAAAYWTLAERELTEAASRFGMRPIPGHAGGFETSLMLALDPQLVDDAARAAMLSRPAEPPAASGYRAAHVEQHGWVEAVEGYTDSSEAASADAGAAFLEVAVSAAARFLADFS